MKYRSRNDIMVEMLEAAKNSAIKTKIMYGANMSFAQMNLYVPHLISKELIEYDEKTKTYQATDLGIDFLKKYESLKF